MKKLLILFSVLLAVSCKKEKDPVPATVTNYAVTYDGNGSTAGTVPSDVGRYESGSTATVLANTGTLEKTGYSFTGWNTSASGNGTDYLPGSTLLMSNSDVKLYAKWWSNSAGSLVRISYYGNGNSAGTAPTDNTSYVPGSQIIVLGNTGGLVKNGAAFTGWNTSSGGSGQSYAPGDKITSQGNVSLYAMYSSTPPAQGKYAGFTISGQVKTKSLLTSSWSTQDIDHTFGANLVDVVWDGSKYAGFTITGQVKTKSSYTSSWVTQDIDHTFGANVVSVVWDGSKYVGFTITGQCKSKSSLTSSWITQDIDHTFGANVVDVVWDGSKYVGFTISGQCKSKSSLTSSWITQDIDNTFGANMVCATWNGSRYAGFTITGQVKTKSSLTSSWSTQDIDNTYGANVVAVVYN